MTETSWHCTSTIISFLFRKGQIVRPALISESLRNISLARTLPTLSNSAICDSGVNFGVPECHRPDASGLDQSLDVSVSRMFGRCKRTVWVACIEQAGFTGHVDNSVLKPVVYTSGRHGQVRGLVERVRGLAHWECCVIAVQTAVNANDARCQCTGPQCSSVYRSQFSPFANVPSTTAFVCVTAVDSSKNLSVNQTCNGFTEPAHP